MMRLLRIVFFFGLLANSLSILAFPGGNNGCLIGISCGSTQNYPPSKPSSLSLPSTDIDGDYQLTWKASTGWRKVGNNDVGWYEVMESKDDSHYEQLDNVNSSKTSYDFSDQGNGIYQYRMRACSVYGDTDLCSDWVTSDEIEVRIKPSTPSKPSDKNSTSTSFSISWSKPSGTVTYYSVQEKVGSGSWSTIVSSQTGTSLSRSGKSNNSVYYYRVRACNTESWSCSSYSSQNTVRVELKPSTPSAPSNINSTATDYTVNWSKPSGSVNFYQVQERESGGSWSTIATNNTATSINRSGKSNNKDYEYRVSACNSYTWSCSGYSSANSVKVRIKPSTPSAPSRPSTSTGSAAVSWTKPSGTVTYYDVQKRKDNGDWKNAKLGDTGTSETLTGLTDGLWDFRVRACNSASWSCSSYSSASSDTKVRLKPSTPSKPTLSNVGTGSHKVNWTKPSGTVTEYDVIEYKDSTSSYSTVANDTTGLSLLLSGKSDGDYTYRVRACNDESWACSAYSSHSSKVTVLNKPGTPSSISTPSQNTDGSISVSWGSSSGQVDEYRLEQQTGSGSWTQVLSDTTSTSTNRSLSDGVYHFRVRACNETGCSDFKTSGETEIRRKPATPSAPSVPSTSSGSANVSWSSQTHATYYDVQQRKGSGSWTNAKTGDTGTSETITDLTDGSYQFRVRACNSESWSCSNYSSASSDTKVRIAPSAPAKPTLNKTQSTDGAYSVSWTKPSGTVTLYDLQAREGSGSWSTVADNTTSLSKGFSGQDTGDYTYRVRACNEFSCSSYSGVSNSIAVRVTPSAPSISKPTGSSDSDGEYTLEWNKPSEATYFNLQRRKNSGSWTNLTSGTSSTGTSYSESVTDNGTYDYRVNACNQATWSCSGYSSIKSVQVDIVPDHASRETVTIANATLNTLNVPDNEAVGALEGQAGVSGGAATYSIPIAIPPGRAGMQPSVSLNYSSRSGNGIAGVGWSLSAGSSIHRCGQTVAHDGKSYAVTYDADEDRLCLDGQRLMVVSGSYGQSGAVYRTEQDSFVRVTQTGGINASNTSFTLSSKNGNTTQYGGTSDSRQLASGRSEILTWAISQVNDPSDNTQSYHYTHHGSGEYTLNTINYTGTSNSEGNREVVFTYEARSDDSSNYLAGGLSRNTQRLAAISTYHSDNLLREYSLNYRLSDTTSRSILQGVTECSETNGSRQCLPETSIDWQANSVSYAENNEQNVLTDIPDGNGFNQINFADVDGDGLPEFIRSYNTIRSYFFGISAGQDEVIFVDDNQQELSRLSFDDSYAYEGVNVDFDLNGKTDRARLNWTLINSNQFKTFYAYGIKYASVDDGSVVTSEIDFPSRVTVTKQPNAPEPEVSFADMNGDSYPDVLVETVDNGQRKLTLFLHNGSSTPGLSLWGDITNLETSNYFSSASEPAIWERYAITDINGDGVNDVVLTLKKDLAETETMEVVLGQHNNGVLSFGSRQSAESLNLPDNTFYQYTNWVDINGDGLSDFVSVEGEDSPYWAVRLNQGNNSFTAPKSLGTSSGTHYWDGYATIKDYNVNSIVGTNVNTTYVSSYNKAQPTFGAAIWVDYNSDGKPELLVPTEAIDNLCVTHVVTATESEAPICDDNLHRAHNKESDNSKVRADKSLRAVKDIRRFKWNLIHFNENQAGNFSAEVTTDFIEAPLNNVEQASFRFTDVNGDGLVDIAIKYAQNYCVDNSNYDWCGSGVSEDFITTALNPVPDVAGTFEVLINTTAKTSDGVYGASDAVTQITDGLGRAAQWRYAPLSRSAGRASDAIEFYNVPKNNDERYVEGDNNSEHFYFASSMQVVSEFIQSDGIGGVNETEYSYREAIYNRMGRGFQGFRSIIVDSPSGIRSVTDFHQKFPLAGQIESVRTCLVSDNDALCSNEPLSQMEITSDYKNTTNDKVFWVIPTQSVEETFDLTDRSKRLSKQTRSINLSDTDSFGNILKSSQTVDNGYSEVKTTTVNAFDNDEDIWWVNKLTQSQVTTQTLNNTSGVYDSSLDSTKALQTDYTWTAERKVDVMITSVTQGEGKTISVNTDYNSYGLPIKVTTASSGETDRVVETGYSDDGYFVEWIDSGLGKAYSEVNPNHGQPDSTTDINGLITQYQYDAFGRAEQVTPPTGQPLYTRFAWCEGDCDGHGFNNSISDNIVYKQTSYQAGAPQSVMYKDKLNRTIATATEGFSENDWVYTTMSYDELGRQTKATHPSYNGSNTKGTHYQRYDVLGRLTEKAIDQAYNQQMEVAYSYHGHRTDIVATSTDKVLNMSRTYSSNGQLIQTTDADDSVTQYAYDAMGNPIVLSDPNGNAITAEYNGLGQKKYVSDPNMGTKTFSYTGFGEVHSETDANKDTYRYAYDTQGRLTERYLNDNLEASFTFDTASQGSSGHCIGLPSSETSENDNQFSRSYTYDGYCRPITTTTTIDGESFTSQTQYDDNYGRVKGTIYPTGITLESRYNDRGYLTEQRNGQSGYVYHQVTEVDARGQVLNALKADGILTESSEYDENSGQMLSVHTHATNGGSQRHRIDYVSYDGFGNLTSQQVETTQSDGSVLTTTETYAYDNLHRLTQSALEGNAINYAYDAAGNLTQKDDYASSFTYGNSTKSNRNAGPNAVYEITKVGGDTAYFDYDDNGNLLSGDGKTLTYNAFNKPISISKNNITSRFYYGSDQMRYKQVKERQSGGDETTLYIGKAYEEIRYDDKVIKKSYLGDSIITETEENNSTDYQIGFVHRDRLGSVVTITDETGQVIDNKSYDPFGKPRKANLEKVTPATLTNIASIENYLATDNAIDLTTRRGFTDHEHLDDAQLIHMNGRVYDYNLGRFLSVDPFIQAPTNSQSMNPYSYIMNNPLAGTDPSGYVACTLHDEKCRNLPPESLSTESGQPNVIEVNNGSKKKQQIIARNMNDSEFEKALKNDTYVSTQNSDGTTTDVSNNFGTKIIFGNPKHGGDLDASKKITGTSQVNSVITADAPAASSTPSISVGNFVKAVSRSLLKGGPIASAIIGALTPSKVADATITDAEREAAITNYIVQNTSEKELSAKLTEARVASKSNEKNFYSVYHRRESPTQTVADSILQTVSQSIWGSSGRMNFEPVVRAFVGPLPAGVPGVEFVTKVTPTSVSPAPGGQWALWYQSSPGVQSRKSGDYAAIPVFLYKNTQVFRE